MVKFGMLKKLKFNKDSILNNTAIISILLFIIALFLRTHNLHDVSVFGGDEQYQATYAMTLVNDLHPIWIGVSAAHTGIYLGPFWTYFTAIWLFLSGGNPLITNYISALIGAITTVVLFYIAKDFFNKKVAIVSAVLYATLPLIVYYDQKYWNPSTLPLLSLILFYSLFKTIKDTRWFIISALGFGLIFHVHLSLLPVGLLGIAMIFLNRKKMSVKVFGISALIFIITYSPLLVFDMNHNWSNLKAPFRVNEITNFDSSSKINPKLHINATFDTLGRLFFLKSGVSSSDEVLFACSNLSTTITLDGSKYSDRTYSSNLLIILSVIPFLMFIFNKKINRSLRSFTSFFVLTIVLSFIFFPGGAFEYYLLGIFPVVILVFATNVLYTKKFIKYLFYFITTVLLILGINTIFKNQSTYGLKHKQVLVQNVSTFIGDKKFELFESGGCHTYEGWRYLFKVYGETPDRSSATDKNLGWLYPNEIYTGDLDYKVIVTENRVPFEASEDIIVEFTQGGFTAYIFKWK